MLEENVRLEMERNHEALYVPKWGKQAFSQPAWCRPAPAFCHQVNPNTWVKPFGANYRRGADCLPGLAGGD